MTEKITFGKFNRTLDKAMKEVHSKDGLIIDLRFNGGGWDHHAYQLASRIIARRDEIGHYEHTRIKGTEEYTEMKYKRVKSSGKHPFTKSIVILTSDDTASASEVFLLVIKDLPNTTIIGDHSEGIFSDTYPFKLPNKWIVTLSHQQYFSKEKINYEGIGIEPDIQVLNLMEDVKNGNDIVIEKAIEYLLIKN